MPDAHSTPFGPPCAAGVAVLEAEPPVLLSLAFSALVLLLLSWSGMAQP